LIKPYIKANKQGYAAKSIVAEHIHLTWQSVSFRERIGKNVKIIFIGASD
jgi:hypothetical protein